MSEATNKSTNSSNPALSVIIPVYKDAKNLQKCLEGIMRSHTRNFECIVVDDGSADETTTAEQFPIKIIPLPVKRGPAHARNAGADVARGDILFFIDSDVVVHPDTLSKVLQTFENYPQIDAVFGSYDDKPEHNGFISQYKNLFHHYVHQTAREQASTFWTGCGAIKKHVFQELAGFNERYGQPAMEDIEFGVRLCKNGNKILLNKDIQVTHLKKWTFWNLVKTDVFARAVPWTYVIFKNKNFPDDLNLKSSQRIRVFFVCSSIGLMTVGTVFSSFLIWALALSLIVLVIVSNLKFYRFFMKKQGLKFALKVIPFHLLYYFYSGLSFFLGALLFYQSKIFPRENSRAKIGLTKKMRYGQV